MGAPLCCSKSMLKRTGEVARGKELGVKEGNIAVGGIQVHIDERWQFGLDPGGFPCL